MKWINNITCFHVIIILTVIFGSIIIICFGMFFNYSAKLSKDEIEIFKLNSWKKEVEKKNGHEQHQIDKLNQKIENLEKLNNLLVEKVLSKSELKSRN